MGDTRVSGLAILHINRDITVSHENVIDRFAKQRNRKRPFIL